MWNGFLKLTVMVGVIGVGLFAAYQAQLGMNKSPFFSAKTSDADKIDESDRSESESPEVAIDERARTEAASSDSFDLFDQTKSEPTGRDSKRVKLKTIEVSDDFSDGFGDENRKVKAPSKKASMQVAAIERAQRQAADTQEESGGFEEIASDPVDEPMTSNQDVTTEPVTKKSRSKAQAAALPSDEEDQSAFDAQISSFEDDTEENKTTTNAIDKSIEVTDTQSPADTPARASQTEPGRARITTDASPVSDIPRSNRAKKNAVKRTESAAESVDNSVGRGSKVVQTSAINDQPSDDTTPVLGSPKLLDNPPDANPINRSNSRTSSAPRSLPAETNDDDALFSRSASKRAQSDQPLLDTNDEMPGNSPLRSRESLGRQSGADRVSPLEMVGDGEIGDASIRGLQQPRLSIEKIAQQQAVLEQPLIYTIVVKNTGTADAHNIVIEDRIPKGSELLGTSPQAEMNGKRLIWNHALLKPNEEKKISIKVIPKQEGSIGSVARVYFATEVTHEIVVMAPQLEFTVKAPGEVRIGQKFEMVFSLKNNGKVDANNIVVRDLVPETLKHEMGLDIECPIGKMAPQEVREIVLPVVATRTGSVVNRAIMTADSGIKKTLDSPIDVVGEVLVLTRTGQNLLYVERPVVFTNNIRNEGNQKADRIKISELVPAGMEFEAASDGGKYDAAQRAVFWTLGPLGPGSDKSVTVKYVPKETGTVDAKITASGNLGSSTAINSTVKVIGKPELQMETLSATGTVTVGEQITSRFQLNNTGTAPANNVQLRVKLPRELRLVSVKGANFQERDGSILFEPIVELGPRKKVAYELTLEPINEADAQIGLEISADHLQKPGRRVETIQIARDALK